MIWFFCPKHFIPTRTVHQIKMFHIYLHNFLGALHSGYPMMGHADAVRNLLDEPKVRREGTWGFIHELGHNHQWKSWTIGKTTETGCNIWSLYVNIKVCT